MSKLNKKYRLDYLTMIKGVVLRKVKFFPTTQATNSWVIANYHKIDEAVRTLNKEVK